MKSTLLNTISQDFSLLFRTTRANVALIFGLTAFPLLGLVGAAVDLGMATTAKAQLDSALDSAALLATTSASAAIAAGTSADRAISTAQTLATARFTAQVAALSAAQVTGVSATISYDGTTLTAVANYTADYPTTLSELLGVGTIPLFGQSNTALSMAPYSTINIMVDTSTSMGIGATQADMDALGVLFNSYTANPPVPVSTLPPNVTYWAGQGCALACHWTDSYTDLYTLAESSGITLRIDVVRNAVADAIGQLSAANANGQLKLGLYGFTNSVNTLFGPSNNISSATSVLPQIKLGIANLTGPQPLAETDIPDAITSVTNTIGMSGDGTSQSAPRQYMIIITDGVQDYFINGSRTMGVMDPSVCNQAKANGVTVLVLYTPYVPLETPYVTTTDPTYMANIAPIASNIWPNLQACASQPSYAIQASDTLTVNAALKQLVAITIKAPSHLTQ